MATTVTVDDALVDELRAELGISEAGALINRALIEMRQRITADRLIALGGSDPNAWAAPRRRPPDFTNLDE